MKKRLLCALLALVMVCTLLPATAFAATLSASQKKKLDKAVTDAVLYMEDRVDVSGFKLKTDDFHTVIDPITDLRPELFYASVNGYSYSHSTDLITSVDISYDDDATTRKSNMDSALRRVYGELTAQHIDQMDDVGKLLCIHDYLCANVRYEGSGESIVITTAYGPLVERKALCQGYAEAFLLLAQHYGIPCGIAYGANHAWNVVKVGGKWYHVDVTFDDPVSDLVGRCNHHHFLLSTEELVEAYPSRRNMRVVTPADNSFTKTAATLPGFWQNTKSRCYFDGTYWYYMNRYGQLMRCKPDGSGETAMTSQRYSWGYVDGYAQMFGLDGKIYYSTPTQIMQYDIAANKAQVYATPQLTGENLIYGMALQSGHIVYAQQSSPSASRQTYLTVDLPACSHSYQKTVVAPTYIAKGYTVHTCKKCGRVYKDSSTDKKKLKTPKITSLKNTYQGVSLKWDKVTGATGYAVYRSGELIDYVASPNYIDRYYPKAKTYKYKIRAYVQYNGKKTYSPYSAVKSIYALASPSDVKLKNSAKGAIKVSWYEYADFSGATGYQISYQLGDNKAKTVTVSAKKSYDHSYTIKKLKKGKTYKIKIRTIKKVNGTRHYSGWTQVKSLKVKK